MKAKLAIGSVVGILVFVSHLGLPAPWGGLVSALLGVAAYLTNHDKLMAAVSSAAKTGLVLLLALMLPGCGAGALAAGAAEATQVLSQADAFGRAVSHVLGWCDARGIDPQTVKDAYAAAHDKDYGMAVAIASELVSKARTQGDPIPEYIEVELRMAEGLIASKAIEDGMKALSTK